MWRIIASRPLAVERTGKIVKIERDAVRLMRLCSPLDEPREGPELADQVEFARVAKP